LENLQNNKHGGQFGGTPPNHLLAFNFKCFDPFNSISMNISEHPLNTLNHHTNP
jgi:hypothetical protein